MQGQRTGRHRVSGHKATAPRQRTHSKGLCAIERHTAWRVRVAHQPVRIVGSVFTSFLVARLDRPQVAVDHGLPLAGEIVADHALQGVEVQARHPGGKTQRDGVAGQCRSCVLMGDVAHRHAD